MKSAFQAIKLKEDDALVKVETLEKDSTVLYVTKGGLCLNFSPDEIPEQGRVAGGVKGMMIADDDSLVFAGQIHSEGEVVVVTDKCFSKRVLAVDIDLMTRYRKGVKICDINGLNGNGVFWAGYVTKPFDILFMDALVFNVDRHTQNYGLLRSRETGEILSMAPNFDNNMALISRGYASDLSNIANPLIGQFQELLREKSIQYPVPKLTKETLETIVNEIMPDAEIRRDYVVRFVWQNYERLCAM